MGWGGVGFLRWVFERDASRHVGPVSCHTEATSLFASLGHRAKARVGKDAHHKRGAPLIRGVLQNVRGKP